MSYENVGNRPVCLGCAFLENRLSTRRHTHLQHRRGTEGFPIRNSGERPLALAPSGF